VTPLDLPISLKAEFATVNAVWTCEGSTSRVDALILSWVKYEKQLRRLFSFLVFQHPNVTKDSIKSVISILAKNTKLYPDTYVMCIEKLGVTSIPILLGLKYEALAPELARIRDYRNKLVHGQITGQDIQTAQIERDVGYVIEWVATLASAAEAEFGYDGIRRNTFITAKAVTKVAVKAYPFDSPAEFEAWLNKIVGAKKK
jgi:hypothetical protein